nr:PAS domain S-box protein [uncultured Sphingomonas sp.]
MDLESTPEETRLRLLVNAVTDYAIYMLDRGGRVSTWNAGAERFKGYRRDEVLGQHFSNFYTDEDRAADLPSRALKIAAREGHFEAEGWRVRKDGSRFWAHVVIDPIRDDEGKLTGFAKVTRDVTRRREQEIALYESEQRFRLLVQGVRDCAIYMLDTEGRISNWNSGAELIKGYSQDEVVGEHFSRFYTEEDRAAGEPQRALKTALHEGKYEREAWRVKKDGSLFWAHVLIDPIFDGNGNHVGFAKVTRDATERKQSQEQLEETQAALAQAQKLQALGELAGGVAHDFNNLMTVVVGSADFLRRRPNLPEAKRQQYVDAIHSTALRATKLTDQLLAFSRRRPLQLEVIDANEAIDGLADLLRRTLGSRIDLKVALDPSAGRIEVDAAQLDNAVLNAAVNARDAMPNGGTLTIATHREVRAEGDRVRIAISDTGLGMPERVLARAFEPFFTTKGVGEGTGLGLSQIHGFAAQAGGEAEISSREGEGTTVSIVLPSSTKELTATDLSDGSTQLPSGLRVLLVEDNLQVRSFATDLLLDLGCEVHPVASAEEALSSLPSFMADVVLSDIVMPGMSGIDLAKQIASEQPSIPVVLATGYSEQAVQGLSGTPVVLKPYSAAELSAVLKGAVGKARLRRSRSSSSS